MRWRRPVGASAPWSASLFLVLGREHQGIHSGSRPPHFVLTGRGPLTTVLFVQSWASQCAVAHWLLFGSQPMSR
jgi:hypothetical protein